MRKPVEMRQSYSIELHEGVVATTVDIWSMFVASCDGDVGRVSELADGLRQMYTCQFDYTSPLHFAVREGRYELVRYLVEMGALDPAYKVHPFMEPLDIVADDRGHTAIAEFLRRNYDDPARSHAWGDTGKVDFGKSESEISFEAAIDKGQYDDVKAFLYDQPELARNEILFWGEGVLAIPCKDGDRRMVELLMSYGASVPELSKWGARYYFKHYDIAEFLLKNGMRPDHQNWRGFTLLHDMANTGDVEKAKLLINAGADVNAIDDEYSSTPLGYAAHWGKREIVTLLLDSGADPNKAAAPWATPLAWAERKGFADIAEDLKRAGAEP